MQIPRLSWTTAAAVGAVIAVMLIFPNALPVVFGLAFIVILYLSFSGRKRLPKERHRVALVESSDEAEESASREPIQMTCQICGNDTFASRYAQLNTVLASFVGLDWANRSVRCEICTRCGHIEWFHELEGAGTLSVIDPHPESEQQAQPPSEQ